MMYHSEAGFVAEPQAGMAADPQVPLAGLPHASSHLLHSNSSSLLMGSRPDSDPHHSQQAKHPPAAVDQPENAYKQSSLPDAARQSHPPESSPMKQTNDSVSQLMPASASQHLDESSMPASIGPHPITGSMGMDQLQSLPHFGEHQMPAQLDTSQPCMLAPNGHALDNGSSSYQACIGPTAPTAELSAGQS